MKKSDFHIPFLLKASVATMLVQSFVISNIVKGMVFSYLFIFFQLGKDIILNLSNKTTQKILIAIAKFVIIFGACQVIIQFLNAVYNPDFSGLIMVSLESTGTALFRRSLFTQSMYLFACVVFFVYIYNSLKGEGNVDKFMKIARTGILIYVIYGFYEFFGYLLTGQNVDFLSNRITGEDTAYGFFQTVRLGGLKIQRMKSLAGEPSMFAFSLVPFTILYYHMKDKLYILFLIALLLSTATTGILGLVFFIIIELIFFRRSLKFILVLGGILAAFSIFFYEVLSGLYSFTFGKFSMANISSIDRFEKLSAHLSFFGNSDIFHILFGYGFGYVRSADGFSTMLVNTGLLGTIAFVVLLIYPILKIRLDTDYRKGLAVALVVLLLLIFISVPEFYYIHIWFLAALLWHEYFLDRKAAGRPQIA